MIPPDHITTVMMTVRQHHRPLTLETCACPLCGEQAQESTRYRSDEVAVVRCVACRVWYLSPRPTAESLAALYAEGGYFEGCGGGYDSYGSQAESLRATFRRFLRSLHGCGMTGGSLLEVGCGYGFLLGEAAPYFENRVGCDLSAEAVSRITGVDQVHVGGVEAVPRGRRFDCIIATHVIEHVHDPLPFVRTLASRLGEGGWLVLAAPNMGGFWRKIMQRRWPSFKFPEHVVFYDRRSLSRVFHAAGLDSVHDVPYPHAFPLSLVCEKLGLPNSPWLPSAKLWLPATTIAVAGQRVGEAIR